MKLSSRPRQFAPLALALMAAGAMPPRSAAGQIAVVGSTVEEHTAAPGQTYEGTA